jgi:hypothetical protein
MKKAAGKHVIQARASECGIYAASPWKTPAIPNLTMRVKFELEAA